MKVVEDSKEGILGFFGPAEELNVIYNKYVDELIEVDEVVDRVVTAMVDELVDELLGAYI